MLRRRPSTAPDFIAAWAERQRARIADPIVRGSVEARIVSQMLDDLERDYDAHQNEELGPTRAAAESGYSRQNLNLLVKQGVISRRRRDLPRKPGHGVVTAPRAPQLHVSPMHASVSSLANDVANDVLAARTARRRAG